jgi:hypothetical protein
MAVHTMPRHHRAAAHFTWCSGNVIDVESADGIVSLESRSYMRMKGELVIKNSLSSIDLTYKCLGRKR